MLIRIFISGDHSPKGEFGPVGGPAVRIRINSSGSGPENRDQNQLSNLCRNPKKSDITRNTVITNKHRLMNDDSQNGEDTHQNLDSGREEESRVGKIRDLLFGEQMVGYDERFAGLERALNEKVDALRESVEKQLEEVRRELGERSDNIERDAVKRDRLATKLENLAASLRDRSE